MRKTVLLMSDQKIYKGILRASKEERNRKGDSEAPLPCKPYGAYCVVQRAFLLALGLLDVLEKCPLCQKSSANLLSHLNKKHSIFSLEELEEEIKNREALSIERQEYARFVDELNRKRASGEISAEERRALDEKWRKKRAEKSRSL